MSYPLAKIEKKARKGELLDYLNKKEAPAFIGPDGRYYIIDRHHTSRALYEARVSFKKFKVEVLKDLGHLNWQEFYAFMRNGNYLYLYDRGMGPKRPRNLPEYIWDLTDDPYRSLSWLVREEGGFDKVDVPYLEFLWGDFFRKKIFLSRASESDLYGVLDEAFELSQSDEADYLPGYKVKESVPIK